MSDKKPNLMVPVRMKAENLGHARSDISVRDVQLTIDEPVERGGTNTAPAPTETTLASLIGCTNVISHKCAKKLNVDIGHLTISLRALFDRRGVTLQEEIDLPFTKIDLTIESDGNATQEELEQVGVELAKYCPVAKLFRMAGTEVNEVWRLKDQSK